MPILTTSEANKLLHDCRKHCYKCAGKSIKNMLACTSSGTCDLHKWRLKFITTQYDAFNDADLKAKYMSHFAAIALEHFSVNGFFPSQVRMIAEQTEKGRPLHPSWIGSACQLMLRDGWMKTGEHRKSPLRSVNWRHEYKFVRREN